MSTDNILYEVNDRLAVMTVNRPDKLNALDARTVKEIHQIAAQAAADDEVGALIITGAGEKAFVAGADIDELARQTLLAGQATATRGQAAFSALENMDKPVIAAVNGYALGGGLELALACHLRVAAANAIMGLPEVGLGIIPGYGGTQRLARLVGRGHALEMILTARKVTAEEGLRMGLVNQVVPTGEALAGARKMAGKILAQSPVAVSLAMSAVRQGLEMSLTAGLAYESSLFGLVSGTEDMKEGMAAFLEKRKPKFTGN